MEGDGSIAWHAEVPGEPFGFYELDRESQANLLGQIGRRLSDIRRHIESMRREGRADAGTFADLVRAAIEIPSIDRVFAIDQQPVLAGWGHVVSKAGVPGGLLAKYDDGISIPLKPRRPFEIWGITVAALLALALVIYLLGPRLWLVALPLPSCRVDAAQLALLQQLLDVRSKGHDDGVDLAALLNDAGTRRAACPLPGPPPPPPALPEKGWENQDLGMLKGCWDRTTSMTTTNIDTGKVYPVKTWKMCFDGAGHGTNELVYEDGASCKGNLTAKFNGPGNLQIADNANVQCNNNTYVFRTIGTCHRIDDQEAECNAYEPKTGRKNLVARFHRPEQQ